MATPIGKVQTALFNAVKKAQGETLSLNSLAWHNPAFFNVHYARLQSAAKALAKKGLIQYENFCKVSLI